MTTHAEGDHAHLHTAFSPDATPLTGKPPLVATASPAKKKWDPKAPRPPSSSLRPGSGGATGSPSARAAAAAAVAAAAAAAKDEEPIGEGDDALLQRPLMDSFVLTQRRMSSHN